MSQCANEPMSQMIGRSKRREVKMRQRAPRVDVAGLARYFAAQPDVVVAYLFGSVARGTARPQSDVDIAVLFDVRGDVLACVEREMEIARNLPKELATGEIDLRSLHNVSPVFLAQVLGTGTLLYARSESERIAFEVRAMSEYLDTRPLREYFKRHLFQEIKEGNFGCRRRCYPRAARITPTIQSAVVGDSRV